MLRDTQLLASTGQNLERFKQVSYDLFTTSHQDSKDSERKVISQQVNAFLRILDEAANEEKNLSVELIKTVHSCFVPTNENIEGSESVLFAGGKFRNDTTYTAPGVKFTKAGVTEILKQIELEEEEKFPTNMGTWIGPGLDKTGMIFPQSFRAGALYRITDIDKNDLSKNRMRISEARNGLAEYIFTQSLTYKYMLLFRRSNKQGLAIEKYMEEETARLIDEFNQQIQNETDSSNRLKVIVLFIKNMLRLHPFAGANHRVFACGLLNFLLIRHRVGCYGMQDRRQFICNGLEESVDAVASHCVLMRDDESPKEFLEQFKKSIQDFIVSQKPPAKFELTNDKLETAKSALETAISKITNTKVQAKFKRVQGHLLALEKDPTLTHEKNGLLVEALQNTTKILQDPPSMSVTDYCAFVDKTIGKQPSRLWKLAGAAMFAAGIALSLLCGLSVTSGVGLGAGVGFGLGAVGAFSLSVTFFAKGSDSGLGGALRDAAKRIERRDLQVLTSPERIVLPGT